jgi:hypothetical protein
MSGMIGTALFGRGMSGMIGTALFGRGMSGMIGTALFGRGMSGMIGTALLLPTAAIAILVAATAATVKTRERILRVVLDMESSGG